MDPISWLLASAEDPYLYLPLLFLFATLAAVLLPVPVEIGLLNPFLSPVLLVLVASAGKAFGGALVFPLGRRIGSRLEREMARSPRAARVHGWVERLVGAYGYWALFGLLSVPFMTDSIPVYVFSILGPTDRSGAPSAAAAGSGRRVHGWRVGPFVAVNFAAAVVRCSAFLVVPWLLGWR